jgi:hypothetical protein
MFSAFLSIARNIGISDCERGFDWSFAIPNLRSSSPVFAFFAKLG